MILSMNVEIFEDKKRRKIFHDKKKEQYYLLNLKNERYAIIFKNSIFNSISIGIIIGTLLSLEYWVWMIIGIGIYVSFFLIFNTKILPRLSKIKTKHAIKEVDTNKDKSSLLRGIAFMIVGGGLIFCLITKQVDGLINIVFVFVCTILATVMGFMQCISFYRNYKKAV